jgi:uncharacterized protein YlxW (UPF0749 family)
MTAPMTVGAPGGARGFLAGRALVVLVTAMVGFLAVSQLRGAPPAERRLASESEGDLARILADLSSEADSLRDEVGTLRLQLAELERSSRDENAATRAAAEQLAGLQVLAGTVAVAGPGVTVEVIDPDRSVGYEHLIDVVQELRDAGAEAVAVNDRRVGATSSFGEQDDRVSLDGTQLAPPYRIAAIGQAETLEGGLQIPGGALDTLTSLKGVRANVARAARVELPALAKAPTFDVARPVGSGA